MFENVIRKTKPKPTVSVTRAATGRGIVLGIRTGNSFADGLLTPQQAEGVMEQIHDELAAQALEAIDEQADDPANIMAGEPVTEIAVETMFDDILPIPTVDQN